jgi:hypothetical protein
MFDVLIIGGAFLVCSKLFGVCGKYGLSPKKKNRNFTHQENVFSAKPFFNIMLDGIAPGTLGS